MKWILAIIAVIAAGSALFYFEQQKGGESNIDDAYLSYIPADTLVYFGAHNSDDIIQFSKTLPVNSSSPSQQVQLQNISQMLSTDGTPKSLFFEHLLAPIFDGGIQSLESLEATFGISLHGPYLFYTDGIFPVIRFKLSKPELFWQRIENATSESQWQYQATTIKEAPVKIWTLSESASPHEFKLAIHSHNDVATITVLSSLDDAQRQEQRLALSAYPSSLKTSGELSALKEKYEFQDSLVSFIHISRIASNLLNLESGTMGKQLNALLPEEQKAQFSSTLSPECQADYAALAASVPRLVMGYNELAYTNKQLQAKLNAVIELTNTKVKTELSSLRGHIPAHATQADNKILATGFGINFTTVTPALTNLWTLFVNSDFKCAKLHEAQDFARKGNPAMLAMFLGMTQGIKGLGMSLYDFAWDPQQMMVTKLSALISIASESPQTVASMTSMLPILAGIQIPADGTPVQLQLPMLPISANLYAAIKGKHLVVYTEDLDEQVAALEKETLEINGLSSLAINYRKFSSVAGISPKPGATSTAQCIKNEEMKHIFSLMPMDIAMITDSTENGIEMLSRFNMDQVNYALPSIGGKYRLEYLNDACQWEPAGTENMLSEGKGNYLERDETDSCDIFTSEYQWKQEGQRIVFTPTKELSRDTCATPLEENELETYECWLMNASEQHFQCLFDAGTVDAALYRYTPI